MVKLKTIVKPKVLIKVLIFSDVIKSYKNIYTEKNKSFKITHLNFYPI